MTLLFAYVIWFWCIHFGPPLVYSAGPFHKKGRPAGRLKPVPAYAEYFYASRPFFGINTHKMRLFDTGFRQY